MSLSSFSQVQDMPAERRGLYRRLRDLVMEADTQPTRFWLAFTGILLGVASWHDGGHCEYAGCVYLFYVTSWFWWAGAWTAYGLLAMWRVFDGVERRRTAMMVNLLGVFLYLTAGIALTVARWPILILSATAFMFALMAFWVVGRTGVNQGKGHKGD